MLIKQQTDKTFVFETLIYLFTIKAHTGSCMMKNMDLYRNHWHILNIYCYWHHTEKRFHHLMEMISRKATDITDNLVWSALVSSAKIQKHPKYNPRHSHLWCVWRQCLGCRSNWWFWLPWWPWQETSGFLNGWELATATWRTGQPEIIPQIKHT